MIRPDGFFSLDGVTSSMCMKYDPSSKTTHAVIAVIRHRRTGKRVSPRKCGNGFKTDRLPFAKGHVIALELGGSDDKYNVVPQFENWQGKANGAWRAMEVALSKKAYANHVMLVQVGYGRGGVEEGYEQAVAEFKKNRIRSWSDPRIPDSFRVRVWNSNVNLQSIQNDHDFDAIVAALGNQPRFSQDFFLGKKMPEPDRSTYITQFALSEAMTKHEEVKKLKKDVSFVSYMLEPGVINDVREDLMEYEGVTPVEAKGMKAYNVMDAYQAGLTERKVRNKVIERGKRGQDTIKGSDLWKQKRDASPERKKK